MYCWTVAKPKQRSPNVCCDSAPWVGSSRHVGAWSRRRDSSSQCAIAPRGIRENQAIGARSREKGTPCKCWQSAPGSLRSRTRTTFVQDLHDIRVVLERGDVQRREATLRREGSGVEVEAAARRGRRERGLRAARRLRRERTLPTPTLTPAPPSHPYHTSPLTPSPAHAPHRPAPPLAPLPACMRAGRPRARQPAAGRRARRGGGGAQRRQRAPPARGAAGAAARSLPPLTP